MSQPIVPRTADASDMDALMRLKEQIHDLHVEGNSKHFRKISADEAENFFKELLQQKDTRVVVAQTDGKIAGYAVLINFRRDPRAGHNSRNVLIVDEICVDALMRGRGIGKALMQSAIDIARGLGADGIELSVWHFNREAIAFYEHIGMRNILTRYSLEL